MDEYKTQKSGIVVVKKINNEKEAGNFMKIKLTRRFLLLSILSILGIVAMLLVLLKVTPLKNLIRLKSNRTAITCPASCPTTCTATGAHDGLCEKLTEAINTTGDVDCSLTATAASNFKTATPNFVTANGIRYFNLGSSADVNGIYTIYVDIDGSKRNGVLNEDVLAFNIYQNGCVIPEKTSMAANSTNYITAVIQYKNSSGATVRPLQGVSYREALCKAGRGPSAAYCAAISPYPAYTTITECNTSSGNYCEVMVINGNRGTSATCMPTSDITVVDPTLDAIVPPVVVTPPSISVTPATSSASIPYTTSASTTNGTFTVTGTGGTGTVTITSPTVPSGSSVTMSPTSFTIANGGTQTITFSATSPASSESTGTFTFGFSASIAGGNTATHTHTQNRAAAPPTCDDGGLTAADMQWQPRISNITAINTCDGSPDLSYDTRGSTYGYCACNLWAAAKKTCFDTYGSGWKTPTDTQICTLLKSGLNADYTWLTSNSGMPQIVIGMHMGGSEPGMPPPCRDDQGYRSVICARPAPDPTATCDDSGVAFWDLQIASGWDATMNFGTFAQVVSKCTDMGSGWRLPTKNELCSMYKYRAHIPEPMSATSYWSATEYSPTTAWVLAFTASMYPVGASPGEGAYIEKTSSTRARCVKSIP